MASAAEQTSQPLGLIAGRGRYPLSLLREARRTGTALAVVALRHAALPALFHQADLACWLDPGQIGAACRFLRACGASQAILAGGLPRWHSLPSLRPDRHAWPLLLRAASWGDDRLLRATAATMASLGVTIVAPGPLAAPLLAPRGQLAGPPLARSARSLVEQAVRAARAWGRRDRGQSIVASPDHLLYEGLGGTDALLRRAARLGGRGTVMVKLAKPQQDHRFDLPTIGPATVAGAGRAHVSAIVVEAGHTLLIDPAETLGLAHRWNITLVGYAPAAPSVASQHVTCLSTGCSEQATLGRHTP